MLRRSPHCQQFARLPLAVRCQPNAHISLNPRQCFLLKSIERSWQPRHKFGDSNTTAVLNLSKILAPPMRKLRLVVCYRPLWCWHHSSQIIVKQLSFVSGTERQSAFFVGKVASVVNTLAATHRIAIEEERA